jgi:hypothetical protein
LLDTSSSPPSGLPRADTHVVAVGAVLAVASRRQHDIYKGALAKPIILPSPPTFWGAARPKRIAAYRKLQARHTRACDALVERELSKKMTSLFDHYGIADKQDIAALAWALAFEHVPGFKVQFPEARSNRGRKRKWHPERLEELYETVQQLKQRLNLNDRQALKFMVSNSEYSVTWGIPSGRKGSKEKLIETLETRLQEAKHLQKLAEQAKRELQTITSSMKFRK